MRVGGDVAVLKGMMKVLVEADDAARAAEQTDACSTGTSSMATRRGIEAVVADLDATPLGGHRTHNPA